MTYKFNHPKYAERFKMPELYNWGAKIAQVVDIVIQSKGPVFIYSFFNSAGILPLAFALEMNGYKRYKQHDRPLLEYQGKTLINRGDYIIYTGNKTLSAYAQEYINKGNEINSYKILNLFVGYNEKKDGLINPQKLMFDGVTSHTGESSFSPVLFSPSSPIDQLAHICYVPLKNDSSGEMKIFTENNEPIDTDIVIDIDLGVIIIIMIIMMMMMMITHRVRPGCVHHHQQ